MYTIRATTRTPDRRDAVLEEMGERARDRGCGVLVTDLGERGWALELSPLVPAGTVLEVAEGEHVVAAAAAEGSVGR